VNNQEFNSVFLEGQRQRNRQDLELLCRNGRLASSVVSNSELN